MYVGDLGLKMAGVLALKLLGYESVKLYDGSWAEWGADTNLPIETEESSAQIIQHTFP